MNSLDAFEKRLRDETAAVEQEIQLHNQQLKALAQSVKPTTGGTEAGR
jgi:hypothetical protein